MKIQIFCFGLMLVLAGIIYAAEKQFEVPQPVAQKKEEPQTLSEDFNLLKGQPDHILKKIASNLSDADLKRFGQVSHPFYAIAQAEFETRASWLWENGKIMPRAFQVTNKLKSVFVSNDGKIITDEMDKNHRIRVWQWDGDSYKPVKEIVDRDLITSDEHEHAAFCPEKNLLAIIHSSKFVNIWDIQTGNKRQFQIDERIHDVFRNQNYSLFSPDGRALATPTDHGCVNLWDIMTGTPKQICGDEASPTFSLAFSPDGKKLAFGLWNTWKGIIWNLETKQKNTHSLHSPSSDLFFTSDGKLIEFYRTFVSDPVIFDVQNNRQISKLKNYNEYDLIYKTSFSHNGVIFAAWSLSKSKIVLWHTQSGKIIRELGTAYTPWVKSLLFSADDKMIVAGCNDGDIFVWQAKLPEKKETKSSK